MALAAHWRQPGPLVLSIFLLSLCRLALFPPTLPPFYSSLLFRITLYKIVLFSVWQSHHHEEEKRALRGEIIVLNNHLMEAKITINKLREDNVSVHNCLVWYRLPQIWTFTVWGDVLGCFQTRKLEIRYSGCERSLEVAAPTPSTVQIFKFRFVQANHRPKSPGYLGVSGTRQSSRSATGYFRTIIPECTGNLGGFWNLGAGAVWSRGKLCNEVSPFSLKWFHWFVCSGASGMGSIFLSLVCGRFYHW